MNPVPFNPWIVVALSISATIAIFLPVVLAVVVRRRTGAGWRYLGIGAATFVIAALVLRMPWQLAVNHWLVKTYGTTGWQLLAWGAFSALTAGLFEETGRYFAFKRFAPEKSFRSGLMFGVGHGGIESILLIGLSIVGGIVTYTLFTHGALPVPEDQREALTAQLRALSVSSSFGGGVERISAIAGHIGMSLLVLRSVTTGRRGYYLLSIALHTLVGLSAVLLIRPAGLWLTELTIAIVALVTLAIGVRSWRLTPGTSSDSATLEARS